MTNLSSRPLPTASASILIVLAACQSTPSEPQLAALSGDFSRFPEENPELVPSDAAARNPWLDGFGGARPLETGDAESPSHLQGDPDPISSEEETMKDTEGYDESPSVDQTQSEPPVSEAAPLLARRFVRYLEGDGSDKLIGIWGQRGTSPEPCVVQIYSNGGTTPWRSVSLPESFPDSGTLVLCSLPEAHSECTEPLSGSLYNGNDALVLDCGGQVVDALGRVGEDPGTAWTSLDGAIRTEGQELIRCGEEFRRDPLSPFVLEDEWISVQNGESPEAAQERCDASGAFEAGGAGGAPSQL